MDQVEKQTASQELTDQEAAQAAGGISTVRLPKVYYRCTICSWNGLFESPSEALESHATKSPGCGGKISRR